MNNMKVLFNDVDRIMRIIYRELCLDYFRIDSVIPENAYCRCLFDLSNEQYRRNVSSRYLQIYPNNYHMDDLEYLLDSLGEILEKKYGDADALNLFPFIADCFLKKSKDNLYVDFDNLLEWDGYRNKLDVKLFLAAYNLHHIETPTSSKVNSIIGHNNKQLYDILERNRISENHMHLKASGYTDDINWYSFLQLKFSDTTQFSKFIESQESLREFENEVGKKEDLLEFILKVRLLRVHLTMYIDKPICCNTRLKKKYNKYLWEIIRADDVLNYLDSRGILKETITLEEEQNKYWNEKYQDLNLTKYAAIELDFYQQIMSYVYSDESDTEYVRTLFNLYIAGMTILKFQFVQDNLGMGFTKFKEKEEIKAFFVKNKKEKDDVIQSVFHKYYREKYIKNIELRITPQGSTSEYIEFIEKLNSMNEQEYDKVKKKLGPNDPSLQKIKYGLIVHFIKPLRSKRMTMIEDQGNKRTKINRDSDILLEALERIEKYTGDLGNAIYDKKEIAHKIVGIDTANFEKNNRPELFGAAYRKIRAGTTNDYVINATYHAGEEFPTLANGLRAIDEVLNFLGYRQNDRIGHALALGINIEDYFHIKRNNIFCSLGDYLDDIVWLYSVLVNSIENSSLLFFLKDEYEKYKWDFFEKVLSYDEIPSFEDYLSSYHLRGDCPDTHLELSKQPELSYEKICSRYPYQLNFKFNKHKSAFSNRTARKLFLRYSFDKNYREYAEQPLHVEISKNYIFCLEKAQRLIQQKVLNLGVFIEANPSSNKKISYVQKYSEISALNISGSVFGNPDSLELPISINTDDSTIFLTNLVNEYSVLAASLLREGYVDKDVYQFVEKLAIASNVHSFVQPY
ncbi:hypothetical protein [Enterococcus sp. DIV0756]|uniref:hypothetical protein n=1 Tax=Enterococcus sp. DIV0756 TaxID=2774636 RepID=UPI003F294D4B